MSSRYDVDIDSNSSQINLHSRANFKLILRVSIADPVLQSTSDLDSGPADHAQEIQRRHIEKSTSSDYYQPTNHSFDDAVERFDGSSTRRRSSCLAIGRAGVAAGTGVIDFPVVHQGFGPPVANQLLFFLNRRWK